MTTLLVVLSILGVVGLLIAWSVSASAVPEQPASGSAWTAPTPVSVPPEPAAPTSRPAHFRHNGHTPSRHSPSRNNACGGYRLDAQKTIRAFDFALKSFGQRAPWSTPEEMGDYIHDLTVMLEEGDLRTASLELLGHDQTVIYRYKIEFRQASGRPSVDAARGIELPVIPPDRIAKHRILVSPVEKLSSYQHRLRRRWGNAEKLVDQTGSRFESVHTRCVNRNRMTGQVFVTDEARRAASIVTVSPAGDYAFARDPSFPVDVYLHRALCDFPMTFLPGSRVSFVPVQTPKGLQGRNIRPA